MLSDEFSHRNDGSQRWLSFPMPLSKCDNHGIWCSNGPDSDLFYSFTCSYQFLPIKWSENHPPTSRQLESPVTVAIRMGCSPATAPTCESPTFSDAVPNLALPKSAELSPQKTCQIPSLCFCFQPPIQSSGPLNGTTNICFQLKTVVVFGCSTTLEVHLHIFEWLVVTHSPPPPYMDGIRSTLTKLLCAAAAMRCLDFFPSRLPGDSQSLCEGESRFQRESYECRKWQQQGMMM